MPLSKTLCRVWRQSTDVPLQMQSITPRNVLPVLSEVANQQKWRFCVSKPLRTPPGLKSRIVLSCESLDSSDHTVWCSWKASTTLNTSAEVISVPGKGNARTAAVACAQRRETRLSAGRGRGAGERHVQARHPRRARKDRVRTFFASNPGRTGNSTATCDAAQRPTGSALWTSGHGGEERAQQPER